MRLQRTDDGQSIPADLEWSVYLSYAYILDISGGWARLGHTDNSTGDPGVSENRTRQT